MPAHAQYYIKNSNQAKALSLSGNSCNVNYNIKKNIINLNLKQENEGESSNYEQESNKNNNNNNNTNNIHNNIHNNNNNNNNGNTNSIIINQSSKPNNNSFLLVKDKNAKKISNSLKNFNQESSYPNTSRGNTSNSKKNQQMNSGGYFKNNKDYDEDYIGNGNSNLNLTNKVWPKSRTFLSIISKMFNDNYIDEYQRGILKEMIMDHNQALNNILEEYEIDADSKNLYESIIQLANSYDKIKSAV